MLYHLLSRLTIPFKVAIFMRCIAMRSKRRAGLQGYLLTDSIRDEMQSMLQICKGIVMISKNLLIDSHAQVEILITEDGEYSLLTLSD